jgi:hypothetical protein
MTFLVQPATDLIIPLYRLATRSNREEREKFFQAALRTSLAAALFFLHVMANKVIEKTTEPRSAASLLGPIGALTIIFYSTAYLHPYAAVLSASASIFYRSAKRHDFYLTPFELAGIIFGLYTASKVKHSLSNYKLDQKIIDLSKKL